MSDEVEDLLQKEKRKRQPNFTVREKLELFSIIKDHYANQLENKGTDKSSVTLKEKSWQNIEKDFNCVSSTGIFRDKDCLKRLYENRKREVKKAVAKNKQEQRKTGGGPEVKIEIDAADDILLQIMNPKTVIGNFSMYDSDADNPTIKQIEEPEKDEYWFVKNSRRSTLKDQHINNHVGQENIEIVEVEPTEELQKEVGCKASSDLDIGKGSSSTSLLSSSYSQMHNKDSYLLESGAEDEAVKKQKEKECNNAMIHKHADSNGGIRKKTQGRRQMPATIRRPGIQILASSHVAKKYDQLLDQRKVLLEKQIELANQDLIFQKRKHQLELELLTAKVINEKK